MENWKDVIGYEGLYQVSDMGRVKSIGYGKEKIMKPGTKKIGYCYVILSKDGIKKSHNIHRLIAIHFLDNPDNEKTINHINGIKTDNRLENLEWCSQSHNIKHAFDNGLKISCKGTNHGSCKLTDQQVLEIRSSNLKGVELARIYGVSGTQISYIKRRMNWNHI
jgi:hypothetical protein